MPEACRLPPALAAELLRLAQASPGEEVCGLIAGDDAGATRVIPIANVAPERARFFELDPRRHIDAMRAIRERGERLWGIFHSHPQGPASPSRHDLERHAYPDALCLVVTPVPPALRAFRIRAGQAREVRLEP